MRYFHVAYVANHNKGQITGSAQFEVEEGYLNHFKTLKQLVDSIEGLSNPVVINIIELNESDYDDFVNPQPHDK